MAVFASASTSIKVHDFFSGNATHEFETTPPNLYQSFLRCSHCGHPMELEHTPQSKSNSLIQSLTWSNDGHWLGVVPDSGRTEIYKIEDESKLIHTVCDVDQQSCASFEKNTKNNIIIGTRTGKLYVYDVESESVRKRYSFKTSSAIAMAESTAEDLIVGLVCADGEAHILSNVCVDYQKSFKISPQQNMTAIRANPLEPYNVFVGNQMGRVALWDIYRHTKTFEANDHKADVIAVAYSPINSYFLVSVGADGRYCFYDNRAQNQCTVKRSMKNYFMAVDVSPDGNFVIMGCDEGKVYIYDLRNTEQPYNTFDAHPSFLKHLSFRKFENIL